MVQFFQIWKLYLIGEEKARSRFHHNILAIGKFFQLDKIYETPILGKPDCCSLNIVPLVLNALKFRTELLGISTVMDGI